MFAAFDFAIERIVVWAYKHWLIVDIIAVQAGYLVGAALRAITSRRKDLDRRKQ